MAATGAGGARRDGRARRASGERRAHGARAAGARASLLADHGIRRRDFPRRGAPAAGRAARAPARSAGRAADAGALHHGRRRLGLSADGRPAVRGLGAERRSAARAGGRALGIFRARRAVQRRAGEVCVKTVLITGAAGDVGTHLSRELADKYRLRLSDKRPLKPPKGQTFMRADVSKMADALRITKGVDAVIHLGGYSVEGPWEAILQANIVGCYNVFEAARRNGVKRIIFPTSNHAVGFYRRDRTIDHRIYPRPDSRYGVSKVFGEALGSLYADKYGMEFFMIRIGNVNPVPIDKRRLAIWISPRDIAQLVSIGIEHPDVKFEIVYGVSGNKRSWYDNSNALRLGYRPQDDSESYADEVLKREKPGDPTAELYQGGIFVVAEDVPNPAAPKKAQQRKGKKK